jgi:hypothetical protein
MIVATRKHGGKTSIKQLRSFAKVELAETAEL